MLLRNITAQKVFYSIKNYDQSTINPVKTIFIFAINVLCLGSIW